MAEKRIAKNPDMLAQTSQEPDSSRVHGWKITPGQLTRDERSFKWSMLGEVEGRYGTLLTDLQKRDISDALSRTILQNPDIREMIAKAYATGGNADDSLLQKLSGRISEQFDKELEKSGSLNAPLKKEK